MERPPISATSARARSNALVPADVTPGTVPVQTANGDLSSVPQEAKLQSSAPAFFRNGKYAVATHADGRSFVSPDAPASPGEVIVLYGTGFGLPGTSIPDGQLITVPTPVANPVSVSVSGVPTDVAFAGLVGPGLYQFNVQLPQALLTGDLPVVVEQAGFSSRDGVLLALKAADQSPPSLFCTDQQLSIPAPLN